MLAPPNEDGPRSETDQGATYRSTGWTTKTTLPPTPATSDLGVHISRGSAGDCCLLCGKGRVDLRTRTAAAPNLSPDQLAGLHADQPSLVVG
jgi:hypothetical protein